MIVLKAGIIGWQREGLQLLQAANRSPRVEVVAIVDDSGSLDTDDPLLGTAQLYEDARHLMLTAKPDLLLIALPPNRSREYLLIAAQAQIPTLQIMPPFEDTACAHHVLTSFQSTGCPYALARFWIDEPAYAQFAQFRQHIGDPLHGLVKLRGPAPEDVWPGCDRVETTTDVLAASGYAVLEFLSEFTGAINSVYAATGKPRMIQRRPATSCSAVLEHQLGFDIALSCAVAEASTFSVELVGPRGTLVATDLGVLHLDEQGQVLRKWDRQCDISHLTAINSFAEQVGTSRAPQTNMGVVLQTVATIEATRLAMRTQQVEIPDELIRVHAQLKS